MSEPIRAGVIGWPVAHSRSPLIHRYWLTRHGIDGRYERIPVRPEELEDFLATLADRGLSGFNVTVPLKERAFDIVARTNPSGLTDTARRLRAVNTIWLRGGAIHADNTDAYGFMASFRQHQPDWRATGQSVLVIGAGGAARAVVAAFLDAGVKTVTVANRTLEKAETLAREMEGPVTPLPLFDLARVLPDSDVLVNTTTLGMPGQPLLDLPLDLLPAQAIVADIVYVPLRTGLLRRAEARGLRTVPGLGMLLHQAVPGFEKWFGVRPRVTRELHDLVAADIEAET